MGGILDDLDPEQRAAAEATSGAVCIIAGAGTGKTRTVTHRLAHAIASGAVRLGTTLAVTHSRKAAAELGERLHRLGVHSGDALTFHAAALKVVRLHWGRAGRPDPEPAVLGESEAWRLWRDALRAVGGVEPDASELRDVMDEVGWARASLISMEAYPAEVERHGRHPGTEARRIVDTWKSYERAKARMGRMDFSDLLDRGAGLIESEAHFAEEIRRRWAHVTVDEYQDVDPSQQRLLDALVGTGRDICVVGDPRQAIYSWKGAEASYLTGFARRYPDARVFDLTRNYRSSPEIVAWANRLGSSPGTRALVAVGAGAGGGGGAGRRPRVTALDTEAGEASWVAGAIRRAVAEGTPASEMAVLYRFNSTQARFEAALTRAGIPVVVAEDTTFFERDEVRAVLVPFGRAARAEPERAGLEVLGQALGRAGFDRERPPAGVGAARGRWESQLALLELVEALPEVAAGAAGAGATAAGGATARELLDQVNLLARRTHGPRTEGVTLSTLHRAKGLEWDVVFVVGATGGAIPSTFAETAAELAEEERLLHVGVSRARRELHVTWARQNGRGWENQPSPYLELLGAARSVGPGSAGAGAVRSSRGRERGQVADVAAGWGGVGEASASCPHCAGALKGISARRLGVCSDCVTRAPGEVGRRARAVMVVVADAAQDAGVDSERMMSGAGLLRLLDSQPADGQGVGATSGVRLSGRWAQAAADALQG